MRFSDLAGLLSGVEADAPEGAAGGPKLRRACFDSRRVQAGDLYCALPGHRADGRRFLADAEAAGAAAALLHGEAPESTLPLLRVPSSGSVAAYAGEAAHLLAGEPSRALWTAAVTGTNGKSTVVHLVDEALRAAGIESASAGTLGLSVAGRMTPVQNTTPAADQLHDWLADARQAGAEAAVLEASSHGIVQDRLAGIQLDAAAWTNLSHDHLDYHQTLDAYGAAKGLLFRHLPAGAVGLLPAAQPGLREHCAGTSAELLDWGLDRGGAALRGELSQADDGLDLRIGGVFGDARVRSRLIGRHNAENLLLAFGLLRLAGLEADAAAAALGQVGPAAGRLQRIAPDAPFALYVDYAHTPEALERVLAALRTSHPAAQLGVVFGAGGDRDVEKRAPMGAAVANGCDWAILTNDNPRSEAPEAIAAQVQSGMVDGAAAVEVELDRRAAIRRAVERLQPGDVLLVAGKGHEDYQEVDGVRHDFDDRVELEEAASCSA